ncbi:MAG TPA: hypothetical protein DCP92_11250 [Nitrospiraceae bacterium]|nr:hypothetical protein [Nitrospiraceae bacterium]
MSEQELRDEIMRLRKRLAELTPPLEVLLKRRGFKLYKKEPSEDLLLPEDPGLADSFYEMMKRYSFRLFLRDVIQKREGFTRASITRYATEGVTGGYLEYLMVAGLVAEKSGIFRLKKPRKSFGETLEWFLAQILRREFGAGVAWGVKFRRPRVGGDYDLIAKMDSSILYMEVKSSPPKQIYQNEIAAFLDRVEDLAPDLALFFMDTELRMKDKIVPMFEEALAARGGSHLSTLPVKRLERELFEIGGKVFIINSKPSIEANIERILGYWLRRMKTV